MRPPHQPLGLPACSRGASHRGRFGRRPAAWPTAPRACQAPCRPARPARREQQRAQRAPAARAPAPPPPPSAGTPAAAPAPLCFAARPCIKSAAAAALRCRPRAPARLPTVAQPCPGRCCCWPHCRRRCRRRLQPGPAEKPGPCTWPQARAHACLGAPRCSPSWHRPGSAGCWPGCRQGAGAPAVGLVPMGGGHCSSGGVFAAGASFSV